MLEPKLEPERGIDQHEKLDHVIVPYSHAQLADRHKPGGSAQDTSEILKDVHLA